MTITLHYHPGNASFTPHALLHEIGVPFRLQLVDRARAEHKGAAYLKLNPNGTIPVLVDDGLVLYETAAIAMHLADRFPQARLAPAVGTAERAQFYKWMVWLTNTLQARLMHYFYPDRLVAEGNAEGTAQVKARAEHDIVGMLQQLDDLLASHGGPWPGVIRARVIPSEKLHQAGKPVAMLAELVKAVPPGGVILDPFMGSGSIGVAACQLGYRYIGIEKSAHWFGVASARLQREAEALFPAA